MEYDTEQDPILMAGAVFCPDCYRAAFPVDATWVSDLVLLVDYGRTCGHIPGQTMVIDLRGLDVGQRFARLLLLEEMRKELAQYVPGRRCQGRNRFAKPCRANAVPGSDYCHHHDCGGLPG